MTTCRVGPDGRDSDGGAVLAGRLQLALSRGAATKPASQRVGRKKREEAGEPTGGRPCHGSAAARQRHFVTGLASAVRALAAMHCTMIWARMAWACWRPCRNRNGTSWGSTARVVGTSSRSEKVHPSSVRRRYPAVVSLTANHLDGRGRRTAKGFREPVTNRAACAIATASQPLSTTFSRLLCAYS